jgi:ferritin-like metal-binding protein YciE
MKITTFGDLYLSQLQDTHSSERQIIRALPKMISAATSPALKEGFTKHLAETKVHIARLDTILSEMGKAQSRKVCEATVGLVKEGAELIDDTAKGDIRDAGLICAAQRIEHYEIACYGTLRTWAALHGRDADVKLLDATLKEERATDEALTSLATSGINAEAMA